MIEVRRAGGLQRLRCLIARLRRDARGLALMEFALSLPLVLAMGGYGTELANYAIIQMRVNQIALTLADNASRIGVDTGQAVLQLREGDLNDVLNGARMMGAGMKLTTYGRVTLSSLETIQRTDYSDASADTAAVQRLHWQRCVGLMKGTASSAYVYDSNYGAATPLATAATDLTYANRGPTVTGIGASPAVTAPSGYAVIFVEVNYQYQPLFGNLFRGKTLIHYTASFVVRDKRYFGMIYNPTTALGAAVTRSTCDLYAS